MARKKHKVERGGVFRQISEFLKNRWASHDVIKRETGLKASQISNALCSRDHKDLFERRINEDRKMEYRLKQAEETKPEEVKLEELAILTPLAEN